MEQQGYDPKTDLSVLMFGLDTALSKAILNHYCKLVATLSGTDEEETRRRILSDRDALIQEMIQMRQATPDR